MSARDLDTVLGIHQASGIGPDGPGYRPPPNRAPAVKTGVVDLRRRSVRTFADVLPSRLWLERALGATYGETAGHRAVPSAGAIYGLTFHALPIESTPTGAAAAEAPAVLHRFDHDGRLRAVRGPCVREPVARAFFTPLTGARWIVIASLDLARYAERYGVRGYRYGLLEAGHWAQAFIQHAGASAYATVPLGAFEDDALVDALGLRAGGLVPAYAVAVGHEPGPRRPTLPQEIATARLLLRPFDSKDAANVQVYADDETWARFLPVPQPYSRADAVAFVERSAGVEGVWACEAGGSVVGSIDLHVLGHGAWMGYSIGRAQWGRGFATEAVQAVIEAAFASLPELRKIYATCHVENAASARVMEKAGMQLDARLPAHGRTRGEIHDELMFSILRPRGV